MQYELGRPYLLIGFSSGGEGTHMSGLRVLSRSSMCFQWHKASCSQCPSKHGVSIGFMWLTFVVHSLASQKLHLATHGIKVGCQVLVGKSI